MGQSWGNHDRTGLNEQFPIEKPNNLEIPSSPLQHPTALPPTRELDSDLLVHELAQVQDGLLLLPLRLVPCRSLAWSCCHPNPDAGTLKMAPHSRRWQGSTGRKKQGSFIETFEKLNSIQKLINNHYLVVVAHGLQEPNVSKSCDTLLLGKECDGWFVGMLRSPLIFHKWERSPDLAVFTYFQSETGRQASYLL